MIKKVTSLLIAALFMLIGINTTVFAADPTYTITINNSTSGHTYEAYQIFTGSLGADGETLGNIEWGLNVDTTLLPSAYSGKTAAEVAASIGSTEADAKAFADAIAPALKTPAFASSTYNETNYTITGLPAGYYLIKDKDGSITGSEVYTSYILKVVGSVEVAPKSSLPTVEKFVKDKTDTTFSDWQESGDYALDEKVEFQLVGTLPTNYADYTEYKYVFHDTLSTGLTFNNDVKVYVYNGVTYEPITSGYTVAPIGTDGVFTVAFEDLKVVEGLKPTDKIVVQYSATLNENAVIGITGNDNKVILEYSNNPNLSDSGTTSFTPEDKVTVYTYEVIVNKVDSNNAALNGAAFTLERLVGTTWTEIKTIGPATGTDVLTKFVFKDLDDGTYRLTETTTPDGYNTISPIQFKIEATHNPSLTALTATAISPSTAVFTTDLTSGKIAGSMTTNVMNMSGTTLPSTGGVGTTIFYVFGSILVASGVILLITKRKMNSEI